MIHYDPSHSKAAQKETRLQRTDKEIAWNQVSRSQGLVQGGLATQVGLGAASWPVSCRPRPAPVFAGGNCLPVWVRPVQCSTIWALVSLHSRRVLNGVAKGLETWVSTESKGQSVSSNGKVPGIWWFSPTETSFTALRARSLKSRCSWDSSPPLPNPQPCLACLCSHGSHVFLGCGCISPSYATSSYDFFLYLC